MVIVSGVFCDLYLFCLLTQTATRYIPIGIGRAVAPLFYTSGSGGFISLPPLVKNERQRVIN